MSALRQFVIVLLGCLSALGGGVAADPFRGADPAWTLLHEPAVERDMRLTPGESRRFRDLLDELDARFFPLRNMSRDESARLADELIIEAHRRLAALLAEKKLQRFAEIHARQEGPAALLRAGLAKRMGYTSGQREQLEKIIADTLAATQELEKRAADGEPREPLEKEFAALKQAELRHVVGILSPSQRAGWQRALGRDFDLTQLGRARFRAPELVDSGEWLNAGPLTLESLAGKVVVLHFYAFGCINCIRNYPSYLAWQEKYRDAGVVILGIHTPETDGERDTSSVKAKADEAGFRFPVLVDRTKANWNAWGNSMWPSVYLIDRQGYLRRFWPGELKWQGATGDAWIEAGIEELLAEASPRKGQEE
jgi:peroxiredoxin